MARTTISVSVLAALLTAMPALAQEEMIGPQPPTEPAGPPREMPFTQLNLDGGYFHMFNADLDGGGDFSMDRFVVNFGGATVFTDKDRLTYGFGYRNDRYDFSPSTSLGPEPWNNINTMTLGGMYSRSLDEKWSAFGGPFMQLSWENGADVDRGFQGGVLGGASYKFSDSLTIGGGVGVSSQIEESVRFFPVLLLEWKISENWAIVNAPNYTGFSRQSFELAYDFGEPEKWLLAFGAGYERNRFRLDKDGVAPGGVGQDEAFKLWVRIVYRTGPKFAVTGILGASVSGELRLENSDGNGLAQRDYDSGPFVGVAGRISF